MLLLYRRNDPWRCGSICIYIPLCFYFIEAYPIFKDSLSLFTFHYASTLSQRIRRYNGGRSSFTFHYASTLSEMQTAITVALLHLHSTMLLLYQCCKVISRFKILHLHSTMLLLYRRKGGQQLLNEFDLHSTMLLLYPLDTDFYHVHNYIYIPLCFYFITILGRTPAMGSRNLHSTMLLLYLPG